MKIKDIRIDGRARFKTLAIGAVFEYLESYYIKTGITDIGANAIDLSNGVADSINIDAEVSELDAELIVKEIEE